jgi:hypothetical protein
VRLPGTGSFVQDATISLAAGDKLTITTPVTPPIPPIPVPTPGVPVIPAGLGSKFRYVPAENGNTLAPLQVATYPDDHIGGPGQHMTVFNRFRHARKPIVANGYLELLAKRNGQTATSPLIGDGKAYPLFDADLVATSVGGNGKTFAYGTFRYWLRFSIGTCHWPAGWLYDTTKWSATEIDAPEVLEGKDIILGVIGQGAGRKSIPMPADIETVFHEFTIVRSPGSVTLSVDGVLRATITGTMPADPLAILLDAKIGYTWAENPDATTRDAFVHCAGITVD